MVSSSKEALMQHHEVVTETYSLMLRWMCVLGFNFLTHFMRMSAALTYMTRELGASELSAGMVITVHLLVLGLVNAYLSFSMDTHSFETMITVRFVMLTLFTLLEWLAQNFAQFAIAYSLASLSVVWIAVSDGYFVQMLPERESKKLCTLAALFDRFAVIIGLTLGGCVAGLLSLRTVFLLSFVVSASSLIFIAVLVRGREKRIKELQSEHIARLYQDHPNLFPNDSFKFPMPFLRIQQHSINQPGFFTSLRSFLSSKSSVPLWFFLTSLGLRTAHNIEFIGWWNVYSDQVFHEPIPESSGQMALSLFAAIPVIALIARVARTHQMSEAELLKWTKILYPLSAASLSILYLWVFPRLSFDWFWLFCPLRLAISIVIDPFRIALQIVECPPDRAGLTFAAVVLSTSLIPATQHIIIGALWNQGGAKHPWFFRWFAVLNGLSALSFCGYLLSKQRRWSLLNFSDRNSNEDGTHYEMMTELSIQE